MAGTVRRLGRYRTSNGPDLAQVGVSEQLVSHTTPSSPSAVFIAYRVGGYVGNWGGQATIRFGIWESGGSGSPGALLARTVETSPTVSYVDGGGGQMRTANLETPLAISTSASVAVGIASRNSAAGVAMYQAQDISEPNENFYRKSISGTNLQSGSGSSASNEGQLALHIEGEYNVAPNTPGAVTRSGSNERRPVMTASFSDPNETLNNGAAYDELTSHRHTVSWGGVERWRATYSANAAEKAARQSSRQIGVTIPFGTVVTYTVEHRDRLGLWSAVRSHTWSVSDPNNAPSAPTGLTPSSTLSGDLSPVFSLIHNDPDGDSSSQVQVQVQLADGSQTLWSSVQSRSVANKSRMSLSYSGTPLKFYRLYRWRARTWDRHGALGPFSGWVNFSIQHNNRNPLTPTNITPGLVVNTRDITIEADFQDPDLPLLPDGQAWEIFVAKQVIIRRLADNFAVYNSGIVTTTQAERNNLRSVTDVTLPLWDTWYVREIRHRDRRGAWSPYARLNIMAQTGASVDMPTQPAGRITDTGSIPAINAVYRNTADLSATRVRVGVFTDQGQLISQRELPINVSRNGTITTAFTALWNDIGGFPFAEGTNYQYAVAARDSSGNWSGWSPFQQLHINARPNIPILYNPKDGTVSPTLPNTIVTATDPDQPSSELTVTAEYYDADTDDLLGTTTLPNISGTTSHGYRPSDIITGYRNVRWRAQANDGFLSSAWSPLWTFNWAPVPDVTVTAPTGPTITTSQPMFEWTSTDQTHWRVRGYDAERLVYDTGEVAGSTKSHVIQPSANWIGAERWNNHETFDWVVSVRDSTTLWGDSPALTLTLEYIPPDPLIVESVEAMSFTGVKGTHYAAIGISQPNATEEEFIRTIVDRVEIDGPAGNENVDTMMHGYFETGNSADTTFADFDMTSNQWYRYTFRYEVQSGVDVISSDPVYAEAMISFHGTLLHMPFDPLGTHVWLPYGEQQYEPEVSWHQGHSEVMTTNGRAPHGYSNSTDYVEWRCVSTLVPRDGATTEQQRDALRRMWKYQNKRFAPNGRPNSVCFREGRGGDDGRVYGRMSEPVRRHSYTRLYTIDFMFRELEELPVEGGEQ